MLRTLITGLFIPCVLVLSAYAAVTPTNTPQTSTQAKPSKKPEQAVNYLLTEMHSVAKPSSAYNELPNYAPPATLADAIRITIETNPTVLRAMSEQAIARYGIQQSQSNIFPSVDMTLGVGREITRSPATRTPAPNAIDQNVTLTRKEAQLTASQLLFDGWSTINQIKRSRYEHKANIYQTAEEKELTGLRAAETFLDVLQSRKIEQLAKKNESKHQVVLKKVRARFEGGAGNKADVDLASSRLAQAQNARIAASGFVLDSQTAYERVVGFIPQQLQAPGFPKIPKNLSLALRTAEEHSPALAVALNNVAATEKNLEVEKSTFSPIITFEGTLARNKDLDGVAGVNHELLGMFMMRYNLFNGGADLASVKQAFYDMLANRQELQDVERTVRENVTNAWNNLTISRERVGAQKRRVSSLREVLIAYQKQFELGQRSLLNVLDVENELFLARRDLITSEFDVLNNGYRLLASMGLLIATVI
jgi:adhesin transport system outer membrane protein